MTLQEALKKVREENLNKQQLEEYHLMLSGLYGDMKIEIGQLKKEKAMFIASRKPEDSIASRKADWEATKSGQRLIEMESYVSATSVMLSSIKSRLYSIY